MTVGVGGVGTGGEAFFVGDMMFIHVVCVGPGDADQRD